MNIRPLIMAAAVSLASHAANAEEALADYGSQTLAQSTSAPTAQVFVITDTKTSAPRRDRSMDLGSPGSPGSVDKIVHLDPGAKYVNVQYGTSVEFVALGAGNTQRAFVWRFDGWPRNSFELNKVAPAGFFDHPVLVYIRPDSETLGG